MAMAVVGLTTSDINIFRGRSSQHFRRGDGMLSLSQPSEDRVHRTIHNPAEQAVLFDPTHPQQIPLITLHYTISQPTFPNHNSKSQLSFFIPSLPKIFDLTNPKPTFK